MSFSLIPEQASEDSDNEASETTLLAEQKNRWLTKLRRERISAIWMNLYISAVITLLCALILVDIFVVHDSLGSISVKNAVEFGGPSPSTTLQTKFGADSNYMSLSHELDFLWDEDLNGGHDKIIDLGRDGPTMLNEEGERIGSPAIISMYVLFQLSLTRAIPPLHTKNIPILHALMSDGAAGIGSTNSIVSPDYVKLFNRLAKV